MNIKAALEALRSGRLVSEGEPLEIDFAPPASPEKIDEIEREVKAKLPTDYRQLLQECAGMDNAYLETDFTGDTMSLGMEEMLPHMVPFATDGCGNFFVVDILPTQEEEAKVFFVCHDPPAMVFVCQGMATWLGLFRSACSGEMTTRDLNWLMEAATFEAYRNAKHPLTHESMLASGDPELREFAESLPEECEAVDLRRPKIGDGFAWSRYGSRSEIYRSPNARLFALKKPPAKKGFFSFLKRGNG